MENRNKPAYPIGQEMFDEMEILEEYLKPTSLTIKELHDRGVISQVIQAMEANKYQAITEILGDVKK